MADLQSPKRDGTPAERICFVIAPIGEQDSPERDRSDQVFEHIITPAVAECGYKPLRADHINNPGPITTQIIEHVLNDPMVIADLTDRNPNVFYELAIRHMLKRPVVQIIHRKDKIPFDVAMQRTVVYDHQHLGMARQAEQRITAQIRAVEQNPAEVDNPIVSTAALLALRESAQPGAEVMAEILNRLASIEGFQQAEQESRDRRKRLMAVNRRRRIEGIHTATGRVVDTPEGYLEMLRAVEATELDARKTDQRPSGDSAG